jgi:hypothetical protein
VRLKVSLYAALAAFGLAGVVPAQADPLRLAQYVPDDLIPPYEVISIVRSLALEPISRPVRYRRCYVLHAIDHRRGYEVRVVVDARIGEVVSVLPVIRSERAAYALPPPRWRRRDVPWRDGYVPEWGEAPPPRTALRGRPDAVPDRDLGPNVIYAPRELMRDAPAPRSSRSVPTRPIEHPPLPRVRPDQVGSTGGIAPQETEATSRSLDEARVVKPEVAASSQPSAAPEVSATPQAPAAPEVATKQPSPEPQVGVTPKVPAVTPPF